MSSNRITIQTGLNTTSTVIKAGSAKLEGVHRVEINIEPGKPVEAVLHCYPDYIEAEALALLREHTTPAEDAEFNTKLEKLRLRTLEKIKEDYSHFEIHGVWPEVT